MSLEDLIFAEAEIKVGTSGSVTVRGLSLSEIMILMQKHAAAMTTLYEFVSENGNNGLDEKSAAVLGKVFIQQFPEFGIELIALAADNHTEKGIANAKKIPFPKQMEILKAIGELTFASEGGVKKSVELVAEMIQALTLLLLNLKLSLPGSGPSDDKSAS